MMTLLTRAISANTLSSGIRVVSMPASASVSAVVLPSMPEVFFRKEKNKANFYETTISRQMNGFFTNKTTNQKNNNKKLTINKQNERNNAHSVPTLQRIL